MSSYVKGSLDGPLSLQTLLHEVQGHGLPLELEISSFSDYSHSDLAVIAIFIQSRKALRKVSIEVGNFHFVDALSQAAACNPSVKELSFRVSKNHGFSVGTEMQQLLRNSKNVLTSLQLMYKENTFQADECSNFARIVADLPHLRELEFMTEQNDENSSPSQKEAYLQFFRTIMRECVHKNTIRPSRISITGDDIPGFGVFLSSPCASGLQEVKFAMESLSRENAVELTGGLRMNQSVMSLDLAFLWAQEDQPGIPVLVNYLKQESSLQKLSLRCTQQYDNYSLWPTLQSSALLAVLQEKTTVKDLCLGRVFDAQSGAALESFLTHNEGVETLKLELANCAELSKSLAAGLQYHHSLRSFHLELGHSEEEADLTSIITALSSRESSQKLHNLSISLRTVSNETGSSLCDFVAHPSCGLKSLGFSCCKESFDLDFLLEAVNKNKNLKQLDLKILDAGDSFDFAAHLLDIAHLISLSVEIESGNPYSLRQRKDEFLKAMKCNEQLESVQISVGVPAEPDVLLNNALKILCIRNKVLKVAVALMEGTLPLSAIPPVLQVIQKECHELMTPTDPHFANILYAMLVSHFRRDRVVPGESVPAQQTPLLFVRLQELSSRSLNEELID